MQNLVNDVIDRTLQITVRVKNNYGAEHIYPICETAKTFARMTDRPTLTRHVVNEIKALGYRINVQQEEIKL